MLGNDGRCCEVQVYLEAVSRGLVPEARMFESQHVVALLRARSRSLART